MSRRRERYAIPDADRWVQPAEASQIMGVSPTTVLRLCHAGKLPATRVAPRRITIRIGDIHAYLEQQQLVGPPTSRRLLDSVIPIQRARSRAS